MLVFFKARLVLLAVPKTGSTALEAALRPLADIVIAHPPRLRHMPLPRFNRRLRGLFEDAAGGRLQTMAVMREPLDWLGSWYRFRQRPFLDGTPNSTRDLTFETFVDGYLAEPRAPYAAIGSQARFLGATPQGTSGVDHLFRHERPDRALAFLADRLDQVVRPDRLNASPQGDLTLGADLQTRLEAALAPDYALYRRLEQADAAVD